MSQPRRWATPRSTAVLRNDLILRLSQDVILAADFGERLDGSVDVVEFVGRGKLHADTGQSLSDHGVVKAYHIDALAIQIAGHVLTELGVVEHDGDDRMTARLDVKAHFGHLSAESLGVGFELVAKGRRFA